MPDQPVPPAALLAELRDLPVLDGAACREVGAPLWNDTLPGETPDERHQRHTAAARICRRCPARWPCTVLAARSLHDETRPAPTTPDRPPRPRHLGRGRGRRL